MKKVLLLIAICTITVSGCASRTLSLQRASAATIPGNYLPTDIEIDEVYRSYANVDWTAHTSDGKKYKCSADDMVRRPTCKKSL